MQYYVLYNGAQADRVGRATDKPDGGESWHWDTKTWEPKPGLSAEMMATGEWTPVTEEVALAATS